MSKDFRLTREAFEIIRGFGIAVALVCGIVYAVKQSKLEAAQKAADNKARAVAWMNYANRHCKKTDIVAGATMKSGKYTYTFSGISWACPDGLNYWVPSNVTDCARSVIDCAFVDRSHIPVVENDTVK